MRIETVIEKLKEVKGILQDATDEDLDRISDDEADEILDLLAEIEIYTQ